MSLVTDKFGCASSMLKKETKQKRKDRKNGNKKRILLSPRILHASEESIELILAVFILQTYNASGRLWANDRLVRPV